MTTNAPTAFIESNALLAILDDDCGEARRLLHALTETDVYGLYNAALSLGALALHTYWAKVNARRLDPPPGAPSHTPEDPHV